MTQGLKTLRGDARDASAKPVAWPGRIQGSASLRRILQAGQHLFQDGEAGHQAFIVRSGHLKSYRIHPDGEEQILGMHGPGHMLRCEALIGKPANCSVIALEIASVEVVDLSRVTLRSGEQSDGMIHLVEEMYRELQRLSRMLFMDRHPADRRLAEFILDFSREAQQRGRCQLDLILPFNRRDLASFLGLAPETLSRTFTRFQEQGILLVDNREIHVLDYPALQNAAGE